MRLRTLGVEQQSIFYQDVFTKQIYSKDTPLSLVRGTTRCDVVSVFTSIELAAMLPDALWSQEATYEGTRLYIYNREFPNKQRAYFWDAKEADVRAGALIYCLENEL